MKQVFISYSSKDFNQAQTVRHVLEQNGITCWMAPADIPGGSNYTKEIPIAIRGCQAFVLMLSDNAQKSHWVLKELDSAVNEGKIILPFQLEDVPLSDEFNFLLTGAQRYAAYQRKSEAMNLLVSRIKAIIQTGAETTPEQPQQPVQEPKPKQPPVNEETLNHVFDSLFDKSAKKKKEEKPKHSGVQSSAACPACGSLDVTEFPDQVKPREIGEQILYHILPIVIAMMAPMAVLLLGFVVVTVMEMVLFFLDPDIFEALAYVLLVLMIPACVFGYRFGKKQACTSITRQRIRKHIKVTECCCNTCQKRFQAVEQE